MTRRERLAAKLWPAIDTYVRQCGGEPNRALDAATALDLILVVHRTTRIEVDRREMRLAIVDAKGFVGAAAKRLGVTRSTLVRRLKDAGLDEYAREWRRKTGWRFGRPRKSA